MLLILDPIDLGCGGLDPLRLVGLSLRFLVDFFRERQLDPGAELGGGPAIQACQVDYARCGGNRRYHTYVGQRQRA